MQHDEEELEFNQKGEEELEFDEKEEEIELDENGKQIPKYWKYYYWEKAIDLFLTVDVLVKIEIDDKNPEAKQFVITPKDVKLSQVKMMKNITILQDE